MVSEAVTKEMKLSEAMRRSTITTGMPRCIARLIAGSSACSVFALTRRRST